MERWQELWYRHRIVIIGGAVVLTVGWGLLSQLGQKQMPTADAKQTPAAQAEIVVDVEGAVAVPGTRHLAEGSLVEDALAAAGGMIEAADQDRAARELNLSDKLRDHQKIYVPIQNATGDPAASSGDSTGGDTSGGPVSLNTATKEQLDGLPGVGPSTAQKILDYRQQHGTFGTIEELKAIPGIGDAKFEQLKDKITV